MLRAEPVLMNEAKHTFCCRKHESKHLFGIEILIYYMMIRVCHNAYTWIKHIYNSFETYTLNKLLAFSNVWFSHLVSLSIMYLQSTTVDIWREGFC